MPIKSIAARQAYNARRRLQRAANAARREGAKAGGAYAERMEQVAKGLEARKAGLYEQPGGGYDASRLANAQEFRAAQVMDEAAQADIIMQGPVGSRIWAATYEIWGELPYEQRKRALLKAFRTNNYKNLIKKLERMFGSAIYGDMTQAKYDEIVTMIMEYLETGEAPKRGKARQRDVMTAPLIESKRAKQAYKKASKALKGIGSNLLLDEPL